MSSSGLLVRLLVITTNIFFIYKLLLDVDSEQGSGAEDDKSSDVHSSVPATGK